MTKNCAHPECLEPRVPPLFDPAARASYSGNQRGLWIRSVYCRAHLDRVMSGERIWEQDKR